MKIAETAPRISGRPAVEDAEEFGTGPAEPAGAPAPRAKIQKGMKEKSEPVPEAAADALDIDAGVADDAAPGTPRPEALQDTLGKAERKKAVAENRGAQAEDKLKRKPAPVPAEKGTARALAAKETVLRIPAARRKQVEAFLRNRKSAERPGAMRDRAVRRETLKAEKEQAGSEAGIGDKAAPAEVKDEAEQAPARQVRLALTKAEFSALQKLLGKTKDGKKPLPEAEIFLLEEVREKTGNRKADGAPKPAPDAAEAEEQKNEPEEPDADATAGTAAANTAEPAAKTPGKMTAGRQDAEAEKPEPLIHVILIFQ
jgi:hypothetical protein